MSPAAASNSTESYLEVFEENVEGKSMRDKLQNIVVTSSMCLSGLLMIGHLLRRKSVWLRALHLPSSVVGGLVGWILFAVVGLFGEDAEALADEWFSVGWDVLPGYCTNVVFCCLFLGTPVPQAREVLQSPRREHLLYGLVVVMGQYVVAAALTGIFIFADPALPAPFATIMPCAAPRNCSAQFCAISAQFRRTSLTRFHRPLAGTATPAAPSSPRRWSLCTRSTPSTTRTATRSRCWRRRSACFWA